MKQNKYGTWAVGAFMLLLSAAACTDSYESTPVDMFTEDYLFSRTDSNGTVVRKYLNRIYYYMRNGHNGVMVTTWMPLPTMRSLLFRPSPMYTNWPSDVTVPPILLTRI